MSRLPALRLRHKLPLHEHFLLTASAVLVAIAPLLAYR